MIYDPRWDEEESESIQNIPLERRIYPLKLKNRNLKENSEKTPSLWYLAGALIYLGTITNISLATSDKNLIPTTSGGLALSTILFGMGKRIENYYNSI